VTEVGLSGRPLSSFDMRRSLPWVTIGLLVLGVGAGAGLGVAGQSSGPRSLSATGQIAAIVAATRATGTARFSDVSTTTSPNRLLRRSSRGRGAVEFGSDSMRTVERDRSIGFSGTSAATAKATAQDNVTDEVWIGRTEYTRFAGDDDLDTPWQKGVTWPRDSLGSLGVLGQIEPLDELAVDESIPGFRVETAGSGTVHGVVARRYRIVVPLCGTSGPHDGISESIGALQLWVDGQDRLIQASLSITEDISKEAHLGNQFPGEGFLAGRASTVSTVDIGDFGTPIAIAAPRVENNKGSGSSVFLNLKRGHCV
jgi:hypothetical protein